MLTDAMDKMWRWDGPTPHDEAHPGFLVPPALAAELASMKPTAWQQRLICDLLGVEPWMLGLAPAPPVSRWQRLTRPLRRAWLKITRRW